MSMTPRQVSRMGKKSINVWMPEAAKTELKIAAIKNNMSMEEFVLRAIEDRFVQLGIVNEDGKPISIW